MKMEIKPDTPLSVLLHLHPEAETVLRDHFKKIDFTSITERVKTLEDISKEEDIDVKTILDELKQKLEK
jgi:hypothetical protein